MIEKINISDRVRYNLYLVIAATLWSFGGVLIKLINWNAIAIAGVRSLFAAIFILFIIKKPNLKFSFKKFFAAFFYASMLTLFVCSTKMTTAANAILLQYTAPIYVGIFGAWILKEKLGLKDWLCIFAIIGGMILFFLDNLTSGNLLGNLLGILSGVSFAFMVIFMKLENEEDPLESMFWGNILTCLFALPFMFQGMPNGKSWLGMFLLGTLQIGLPYVFYSKAVKNVPAIDAVLIPMIEPILNPIWVFIFIGEVPGVWAILGGIIVLISILARTYRKPIKENKNLSKINLQ
jgi:drug/metabolite transporter (DMT)-like permease